MLAIVACDDCGSAISWEHSDDWDPRNPGGFEKLADAAAALSTQQSESANEPPPKPQPKQLVKSIYCGGFLRRPVTDISRAFDATEDD